MRRTSQGPTPSATCRVIRRTCPLRPRLGIILGSGFGPVADALTVEHRFPYRDLPGFPVGGVPGHGQQLLLGHWSGVPVAVLQGRAHFYEGFTMAEITFPTRVLSELGIEILLATNAAGGINPAYRPGDFMVLEDHIQGMGANPLCGPAIGDLPRFVDLTEAYDATLRRTLRSCARGLHVRCHSGVYFAVSGPSYETPAEIRAFRRLGADAVGMSTVPEVIVARQCGIRVAAMSCITNAAAGLSKDRAPVSHEEVLAMARNREGVATRLIARFVERAR